MLTTQQEHELPTFPFAAGPGVSTWRTVTLHVGVMYVFVTYSIRHDTGWLPQTSIFWRHEDALAFCKQVNKDKKRKLGDVFLLVPIAEENVHRWSFVPVGQIFVRRADETEGEFPLYVTVDGEVVGGLSFDEPDNVATPDHYETLEKVFPA